MYKISALSPLNLEFLAGYLDFVEIELAVNTVLLIEHCLMDK